MENKRYCGFEYSYEGPVMEFDKIVANNWKSSTVATSEAKARSNLAYQFKKQFGKTPNSKITLPGKIKQLVARGKTS